MADTKAQLLTPDFIGRQVQVIVNEGTTASGRVTGYLIEAGANAVRTFVETIVRSSTSVQIELANLGTIGVTGDAIVRTAGK